MNNTLLVKRATVATLKKNTFWREPRDGNGAGRGRRKGSSFPPRMILSCPIPVMQVFILAPHDFVLPHPRPAPPRMTGKILLPHPRPSPPIRALQSPASPRKIYFLLICLTTSKFFLMKPISLIKIYLKLQLNLSHQIKSIFRKN